MAGIVTGARSGILYIRHEYEHPREILQKEIDRCYREGLLGPANSRRAIWLSTLKFL